MRVPPLVLLALASSCTPCGQTRPVAPPAQPRQVREPTVAGRFYPGDAAALAQQVDGFLGKARRVAEAPVTAVLVPHAGLEFSGQVAAESFKQLEPGFSRVVIVAANHNGRARYAGLAVDHPTHYRVPGLEVAVSSAVAELLQRPGFVDVPAAHTMHMVEIELPFLRAVNGGPFELVPIVVGELNVAGANAAAEELARLASPGTRFVFSVDLSHYHPYDQAVALDRSCLDALARADAQEVARCDTDGTQVLMMMNALAARLALTPRLLTYANSGDLGASHSAVVGYGALVYEDRFALGPAEGKALVALARAAVEAKVREGRTLPVPEELLGRWPRLGVQRGAFVTLRENGALRGCIGSLIASRPLALDVIHNAINAAASDPRFQPVRPEELPAIDVSISVLDAPRPLVDAGGPEELLRRLGQMKPGLILQHRGRRSTFLPEVWDELPEPRSFLGHLCQKQGSPPECWRDPATRFETYLSQHFTER